MNDLKKVRKKASGTNSKGVASGQRILSPPQARVHTLARRNRSLFAWLSVHGGWAGFTQAHPRAPGAWPSSPAASAMSQSTLPTMTVRKLAVEAADNGLLVPQLANAITPARKGVAGRRACVRGTGFR